MNMENFRQVGKEYSGKVYKGPMVDAFNRLTQSSIPTKSEQVLSAIERKGGFGSSTDRFTLVTEIEAPGPGQYVNPAVSESPSLSRKGYGGLISKSPRFKKYQYNTPVPGPGTYTGVKDQGNGIHSVFCKPVGRAPVKPDQPAPGDYEVQAISKNVNITSPFKSKSKRQYGSMSASPSPWQYNISSTFSADKHPSAAFKMPVRARRCPINLYDPHASVPTEVSPGPGDYYNTSLPPITHRPSPAFIRTDVDRFGGTSKERRNKDITPGPGAYYMYSVSEKNPVSGAVFMSESNRSVIKNPQKLPGPAFYQPVPVPKKKSFHLNSNKMWI